MINKNKKIKAFSTSALTTLLGALLVVTNISSSSATTSSDSTFAASASVASSCIISATPMTFSAYTETLITATTDVTANCTFGTTGTITLTTVADGTSNSYKLVRTGGSASTANDVLEVSFKKTSDSTALYSGSGSFSVTGTGSAVTSSALITGTIAASQTAKTAGTFSKSLTLTVTY
jgi:spore coat protein U-like protein